MGCTGQMKQPLGSSASTKFSLTPPMSYLPQDPGPGILAPGTTFHHVRGQQQNQLTQKALRKLPLCCVTQQQYSVYAHSRAHSSSFPKQDLSCSSGAFSHNHSAQFPYTEA